MMMSRLVLRVIVQAVIGGPCGGASPLIEPFEKRRLTLAQDGDYFGPFMANSAARSSLAVDKRKPHLVARLFHCCGGLHVYCSQGALLLPSTAI